MSRRLIAVGLVLYGFLALVAPPSAYSSTTYAVLFRLAAHFGPPLRVWGGVFIFAGIAGLTLHEVGRFCMIGVTWSWTIGLWSAVITGQAQTWGGPLWPTMIAMLMLANVGKERVW